MKFFAKDEDISTLTSKSKFRLEIIVKNCRVNDYNNVLTPQCEIDRYEISDIEDDNELSWEDLFK